MQLRWALVLLLLAGCWDRDEGTTHTADPEPPVVVEPEPEDPDPETPDPDPDPDPDPEPDPEPEPEPEPEPVHELDVYIDDTYGDRFQPVIVRVDYRIDGVGADFEFRVPYGEVKEFPNYLEIYGDGQRHEDLVLTVNGEEFLYQLYPEPRCGRVDLYTDCQGYEYKGRDDGYIYYGEDDDQVVVWGLNYLYYDSTLEPYAYYEVQPGDRAFDEAEYVVSWMNRIYEDAGVHIRFELEYVGRGRWMTNSGHTQMVRDIGVGDVAVGRGVTCPGTGGCARINKSFREGTGFTLAGTILGANATVALHEIGHMVGLAHGPDNVAYADEGYIWPEFGHGHSTPFCGYVSDLMSYAANGSTHNNSLMTCGEKFPGQPIMAGDRTYADSAYHLNRVRYDVSMIGLAPDAPPAYIDEAPEMGPLILD